jgi:hypothetical protein
MFSIKVGSPCLGGRQPGRQRGSGGWDTYHDSSSVDSNGLKTVGRCGFTALDASKTDFVECGVLRHVVECLAWAEVGLDIVEEE